MIVRTWRGAVRARDAEAYREYLRQTGFAEYAGTPGHLGTLGLRRTSGDTTEILLLTLWSGPEAVRAFAGDDPERAVFYPEDERFLVNADERVGHFEPFFTDGEAFLAGGDTSLGDAGAPTVPGRRPRSGRPAFRCDLGLRSRPAEATGVVVARLDPLRRRRGPAALRRRRFPLDENEAPGLAGPGAGRRQVHGRESMLALRWTTCCPDCRSTGPAPA